MEQELEKRRTEEEQLRQQASLDVLTGLQNRQAADETRLYDTAANRFTLCFLDPDGSKMSMTGSGSRRG